MEKNEDVARAAYFGYVDWQGYPNGMPTWNEMSEADKSVWYSVAHWVMLVLQHKKPTPSELPEE